MRGFAEWLLGLAAQQPGQYRRLRRIRRRIYRTVATLHAEVLRSAEPIAFEDLPGATFNPIRAGASFGKVQECAWLHVTGTVPDGVTDPVVLLGIRGEGLVHSADGEILDSVSTVFLQGDLPHAGGRFRPVLGVDTSGPAVDFYADVAYNGFLIYPVGRGRFHGARLAVRDDDAFALYYDYLTLVVLAGATEDAVLAAGLHRALDAAWSRFRAGDLAAARAELAGRLAEPSTDDFLYSAVGHGHLDMAWLWPLRETRRKAARTYARALNTIERRPGYIYGTSQPQQLQWTKERHPGLYARIGAAVAAGRLELQGSFWVETDTNMPGGESLVRQALVGRRFLQQEFGLTDDDLRLCWLPDTFGYTGALPQILRKSGMDWFQTIKLAWNKFNDHPYRTFHWEGIDGSSVLVHMPPEGDYNSRGAADGLLTGLKKYPERDLGAALLVYGSGDGGGGPGEVHLELTSREHHLRGLPRVEYSRAADFFRRLEGLDVTHRYRGELYLEAHQGTYTTQAKIKKHTRVVERMLHEAEALAALTGQPSRDRLEPHWRDALLHHFHDILPGSSIARVNSEAAETHARLETELGAYAGELLERVPRDGEAPSALNLTGVPRDENIRVGDTWHHAKLGPYQAAALVEAAPAPELTAGDDSIGNGILTLRFGRSGEVISCVDAAGGEHAGTGLNRLVLHRDPYQWPWDAWDIGQGYLTRSPRVLRPVDVTTEIDGPTVVRTQRYRFGRSTLEQRVVLEAGSPLVRFETRVDWHETHRMLRAEFRPTHYGPVSKSEIQFGHIERPTTEDGPVETAQFEICAHKWIATEDAGGGFAVLNDSKYGHRAKSGLLSLNLLRSPTFPDKTADRGSQEFTYAFRPFEPGDLTAVIRDGYRLNNPLRVLTGVSFASMATAGDPAVIIETIKPAENGEGTVIRMYESLGRATTTSLRTTLPHTTVTETDLLERATVPADLDELLFGPFEIKTLRLKLRPDHGRRTTVTSTTEPTKKPLKAIWIPSQRSQSTAIVTAAFGQNIVYATVTTFILLYLVQYAKFSTGAIAVVTVVLTVARIVDAVADPVVGSLIDMTRTRWGKLRPFVLFSAVPVAVLSTLLFAVPDAAESTQLIYFTVVYLVWGFVYSACDVPLWGLIGSAFPEPTRRARVIGNVRAFGAVALGLSTLGILPLARALSFGPDATPAGWTLAVGLASAIGMALYLLAFVFPRERSSAVRERLTFRELFGALFRNKPLLAVLAGSVLGFGRYVVQAGGAVFVVIAYGGDDNFIKVGAAIIVGMVIASFVTPVVMRRVSGRTLVLGSSLAAAVIYVAMYFAGFHDVVVLIVFIFLTGLTLGVFLVAQTTMIADAVDHAEQKTGVRNDGISFATLTFVTKVMSAFSVLAFGIFVVIAGYQDGVEVTPEMQNTVFLAITILPAISCIASLVPFYFYKLKAG